MRRILIVSDDSEFVSKCAVLENCGMTVETTTDFKTALQDLLNSSFDTAIINLVEGPEGIDFIARVRATPQLSYLPILVVAEWGTGYGTLALSLGANAYESTPCDTADLVAAVKRLLKPQLAVAK
jgi:DNA-binding response OmpR family regulator